MADLPRVLNAHDYYQHWLSPESWLLRNEERLILNSCDYLGSYVLHVRAKLMGQIYTTKEYDKNRKRANSFIQLKCNGSERNAYGQILFFVRAENSSFYCLVKVFKVNHLNLLFQNESRYVVRNFSAI